MAAKLKALQAWCKKQCEGYRDVQVTNLTSSFKSGLAFCAIIHRFRPDLIDYDSLSKENVFDNNKLAFDVANNELGIAALLDAEDMVAMKVPDKLCIVTYVAQYANYFRDKTPVGGPEVKEKVATKRHTPKESVEPVREAKRPMPDATVKQWTPTKAPSGGHVEASAKRNTFGDKCAMCGKKVYVLERHFEGTTLYHRRCIRGSQRAASFGKEGETSGQTTREDVGKREKENRVPPNGPSSLLTQVNGGPKPYASSRDDVGKKPDTTGMTGMSSLLSKLRGGPAPYKGEAATTPQNVRHLDVQKTDWNKFLGVSPPEKEGHTRGVTKMDVDDDVPPPLPLSKVPPKKPPRLPQMTRFSTATEKAQPTPVERFKRVTEEQPKTAKKDTSTSLHEKPENTAVLSGLLHSLANIRQDGSGGTSGPYAGSQAAPPRFTLIKTTSLVSKPDTKMPNDDSHVMSTHSARKNTPFESVQQSEKSKKGNISGVTTKKLDSSQDLKAKIRAFEHAKDGTDSEGRDLPTFCTSHKTTDQKSASSVPTSLENAKFPKQSQPDSDLKSMSTNDKLNKGPTIIRPPMSILKNGSGSSHAKLTQPNGRDHNDSADIKTTSASESHVKTHGSGASSVVAGNNFSAFNINDSMELDNGRNSERGEGKEKGEKRQKGEKAARGKPTWQVEVEARGGKIPRQQVPKHGKKESGGSDPAGSETDWQREARRREMARGGKYADPEKNLVHISKVSPGKTSPGPESVGSPTEQVGSPTERVRSPTGRVGSPIDCKRSPAELAQSPTGWVESHTGLPAEQVRTPTEHTGSPTEHTGSRAACTGSPAERTGSPAERMGSPAQHTGSPKNTHLKRGEVFYIKDQSGEDTSPRPVEKAVEKESDAKTEWQLEAEHRKWNRLHKDETMSPTPALRNISRRSPAGSTELARPPSVSVVVDKPARVRVKPDVTKTQWQIDAEKRKTARNEVDPGKTVEYTEVVIENVSGRIERPYVIGQENRVKYTDVNVMTKKVIRPETQFSFNLHDFKPPADSVEPVNSVNPPPARPPTLPSRKTRQAPLPPTVIRPSQTPKRVVNAEKRMSPVEICRQLRQIDVELRDLEAEGRELETQIRSGTDDEMDTSEDLMVQWFGLINQRNEFVRKEADLMYRQKQQELEGIHEDLEYELRCLMAKHDHQKTASEREREKVLLKELLETVNMRNSIVDSMEEDRIRYIEEDHEIAEVLRMKTRGSDTQLPSNADTTAQKPTNKQQKKNGFTKPVATVR